ncbi:MAG: hypothetical protein JW889_10410 [Verrucomicrobia bacterium]|nr:hypothetical protein [Verrucomicrobiota bacterium]
MTKPNHLRRTFSECFAMSLDVLIGGVLLVVLVCGFGTPASAATSRTRDGSSTGDVVQIEPVPRFTESEVRALIEKPSVTFTVDNPRIASGGQAVLSWRVENADTASISGLGGVSLSGTRTVKPTEKTTYTLSATNRNGTVSKSVTVDISTLAVVTNLRIVAPALLLENVAYNFVDEAASATWASSVPLTFGGAGGARGWARVVNSVRAEDNKDYEKVLQVSPENKADGFVYGEYAVAIPPNAKLRATVSFTAGHGSPDGATVSVQVRAPSVARRVKPSWKQVLTKTIMRDNKLDAVEVDLSAWANQKVSIRLVVNAHSNATDDLVLWIAPRIIK